MPPRNERIATMVRNEIARNPNVGNDVLLQKARTLDPSVRRLSPRQFHATYRLPALRSVKQASKPAGAPSGGARAARSAPAAAPAPAAATTAPATPSAAPSPAAAPAAASSAPATAASTAAHTAAPTAASSATSSATPAAGTSSSHGRSSTALARPHAAEREAVRQILQLVAREALSTEDRTSFVKLLDSLDERAAVILGIFGRH
jgi:hypothetical protein